MSRAGRLIGLIVVVSFCVLAVLAWRSVSKHSVEEAGIAAERAFATAWGQGREAYQGGDWQLATDHFEMAVKLLNVPAVGTARDTKALRFHCFVAHAYLAEIYSRRTNQAAFQMHYQQAYRLGTEFQHAIKTMSDISNIIDRYERSLREGGSPNN
jgi:hypothetical protein